MAKLGNIGETYTRYECVWKPASLGFPDALKNSSRKLKAPAKLENQRHETWGILLSGAYYPELATSLFSCNGVFISRVIFRYAFDAKSTVSRSLLCLFRRILFADRCVFRFPADEEDVRGSSYCRFSSELLLSAYKNWDTWMKHCQSNQKKVPCVHPPCWFIKRVSCSSYALTVHY